MWKSNFATDGVPYTLLLIARPESQPKTKPSWVHFSLMSFVFTPAAKNIPIAIRVAFTV